MKAIWVFENNRDVFSFNELELFSAIASICIWKKNHPQYVTYLYCDDYMYKYFEKLGILDLWDVVDTTILSDKSDNINRTFFWAASKLKVLKQIQAPYIIMDLDFYFLNDCLTEKDFENDAIYSYVESGYNYYLTPDNKTFTDANITFPNYNWNFDAANVSLLYIKNQEIHAEYSSLALEYMQKLSTLKEYITGGHMVFCEQKLLYQILCNRNVKHVPLVAEKFNCRQDKFIENSAENGIWHVDNIGKSFQHLGINKYRYTPDSDNYLNEKDIIFDAMSKHCPDKLIKVFKAFKENKTWK